MPPTLPALAPFVLAGAAFGALGAISLVAALVALLRRRPWRFAWRTLVGVVSSTFVPVTEAATFEVRVSTTGLLIRKLDPAR